MLLPKRQVFEDPPAKKEETPPAGEVTTEATPQSVDQVTQGLNHKIKEARDLARELSGKTGEEAKAAVKKIKELVEGVEKTPGMKQEHVYSLDVIKARTLKQAKALGGNIEFAGGYLFDLKSSFSSVNKAVEGSGEMNKQDFGRLIHNITRIYYAIRAWFNPNFDPDLPSETASATPPPAAPAAGEKKPEEKKDEKKKGGGDGEKDGQKEKAKEEEKKSDFPNLSTIEMVKDSKDVDFRNDSILFVEGSTRYRLGYMGDNIQVKEGESFVDLNPDWKKRYEPLLRYLQTHYQLASELSGMVVEKNLKGEPDVEKKTRTTPRLMQLILQLQKEENAKQGPHKDMAQILKNNWPKFWVDTAKSYFKNNPMAVIEELDTNNLGQKETIIGLFKGL